MEGLSCQGAPPYSLMLPLGLPWRTQSQRLCLPPAMLTQPQPGSCLAHPQEHVPGGLTHTASPVPTQGRGERVHDLKGRVLLCPEKSEAEGQRRKERIVGAERDLSREQSPRSHWALSRCRPRSSALPVVSHEIHTRTQPHEVDAAVTLTKGHKR